MIGSFLCAPLRNLSSPLWLAFGVLSALTAASKIQTTMSTWLWAVGLIVFYLLLTRWLLPKLGIPT